MAAPLFSSPRNVSPHSDCQHGFLRHLLEMFVVMLLGMVVGAIIFTFGARLFDGSSLTWDEARLRYPEACLLVIGAIMSAPMALWMRHRGHNWQRGAEMTAAMIVPAVALICLFWLNVLGSDPLCALYCVLMIPAMIGVMALRRAEYSGAAGHALMAN